MKPLRSLRHLLELFVLPGLAAILPWTLCFRCYRLLARLPIYRAQSAAALTGAQHLQRIADPRRWLAEHRLTRLCDHADLYLSMTRGDRWMHRHLQVRGQWPLASQPFLAVTFHWGAGWWALRHLRAQGVRSAFLSIRFDRTSFQGDRVAFGYANLRMREVCRASGADAIYTNGASAAIREAWRQGISVVALFDVPPQLTPHSVTSRVLERDIRLPSGLARLARDEGVPVVAFNVGIDAATGARLLEISPPCGGGDEFETVAYLAKEFDRLLSRSLAAWHLCADAPVFFPVAPRPST
jgi:hypothetical protein